MTDMPPAFNTLEVRYFILDIQLLSETAKTSQTNLNTPKWPEHDDGFLVFFLSFRHKKTNSFTTVRVTQL